MKGFGIRIDQWTRVFQSFKDDRNSTSSCKQRFSYHKPLSSGEEAQVIAGEEHTPEQTMGAAKRETDRNREVTDDDDDDDAVFFDCLDNTDWGENCPSGGGSDSVILYTTSLRGIRKTFEDCRRVKFLLDSFGILYYERDVALDMESREEVRRMLGTAILLPSLFVRGRYVGGADEVVELHEQGKLKDLFRGIAVEEGGSRRKCGGCGGVGFVMCGECSGSRKLYGDGDGKSGGEVLFSVCLCCNENGLIKCPVCS